MGKLGQEGWGQQEPQQAFLMGREFTPPSTIIANIVESYPYSKLYAYSKCFMYVNLSIALWGRDG